MWQLILLCSVVFTEILAKNSECGERLPGSCCANGKKYNFGDFILKKSENLEICQRRVCIFGRLIKLGDYPCPEKTENNRKYIIDKQPAEFGQFYVRRRSVPTTIPPYFTTTIPTTTIPSNMCHHNGKWYMPGEMIETGQSGHWCYFTQCGHEGQVMYGDDFNCGMTTIPTTIPTTTMPTTTTTAFVITPMYCFFNDPKTGETVVWRGGTEGKLSDGTACRCEYWGRLSCPENNVGR
uniref:Uncharacterized protein LOC111136478 n=1 Tax=Crassostrea virginica TaxID=6565 RepID=A0A8B8ETK2_CRAVI|nr:uncharacterized protein LOC111136478 [Crassostrea virginica]